MRTNAFLSDESKYVGYTLFSITYLIDGRQCRHHKICTSPEEQAVFGLHTVLVCWCSTEHFSILIFAPTSWLW